MATTNTTSHNPDLWAGILESLGIAEDGLNQIIRRAEDDEAVEEELRALRQLRGSVGWIRKSVIARGGVRKEVASMKRNRIKAA